MSLNELIESCVERMEGDWFSLQYYPFKQKWVAEIVVIGEPESKFGEGKTAREAMEKLLVAVCDQAQNS